MIDLAQSARVAAQMVADVAGAAATGALLNRFWLGLDSTVPLEATLRRWLIAASVLLAAGSAIEFLAFTAIMTEATSWAPLQAAMPDVMTTEAGRTLGLLSGGSVLLLLLSWVPSVLRSKPLRITALALMGVLWLLRTPLGHASSDGSWTLREAVQFIHLVSVAVWGGGVMVAGLVSTPALLAGGSSEKSLALGRRLSRTVTVALPCVLLSGVYNSWRGLGGSLSRLPHSEWGQILLAKLTIVCAALALGARMRQMLHRPHHTSRSVEANSQFMRRWLRIEALSMLGILILSAWLANAPPADMP